MAIYRFEVKIHSRRQAGSAPSRSAYRSGTRVNQKSSSLVGTAAYRSGEALRDQRTGIVHDFRNKGGVDHSEIIAPANAPDWVYDRSALWNSVEAVEKRRDARLAREFLLSCPRELSSEQNVELARRFISEQLVSRGMIVDFALHKPKASDGQDQPHVHAIATDRTIGPDGWGKKDTSWNKKEWLVALREQWEHYVNEALEDAGSAERVDHRSLKDRGIDRLPQPKLGPACHAKGEKVWARKRKNKFQDTADRNQGIDIAGAVVRVVTAAMLGGPSAAVIAGLGELGLMPGIGSPEGSVIAGIVRNVERAVGVGR